MSVIDSRIGEPIMSKFPWETCIITSPEGEEFPGYITRGSKDANGEYEFFEASRVFVYEYQGREVLVDIEKMQQPFLVYHRRKSGKYHTEKASSPKNPVTGKKEIFKAFITQDQRDVYTYAGHSIPDEFLVNVSDEDRAALKRLEAEEIEMFLSEDFLKLIS